MSTRKTGSEARFERLMWFFMVLIFILISFSEGLVFPAYLVPFAIAAIILISAFYQYRKGWKISPIPTIVAGVLIVVGFLDVYLNLGDRIDPILASLIGTIVVILTGVITNEG